MHESQYKVIQGEVSKKWFIMFAYRPESINRNLFFEEITLSLSKALNKYENIILIGDLNIDISIPNNDISNLLGNLCDVFDLSNMIKKHYLFYEPKRNIYWCNAHK